MTYERFPEPRPLTEYAGHAGPEVGGRALTPSAFEALLEAKKTGRPPALVVIGAYHRDDGATFLDFGVPRYHIETTTNHRLTAHGFLWTCPSCGLHSGKHSKSCDYS